MADHRRSAMTLMRPKRLGTMETAAGRSAVWLWLTLPVAVLVAVAAGTELLFGGVFRGDEPAFVAQAIGQDVVTLVVALPALVAGAYLASRGSDRARLVWLGILVYLVYTYAIYAFQVRFNALFLVYVALLGCSLYALIGGLATTDLGRIKARFSVRIPVKTVSVFLLVVAALFYLSWLGEVVPALITGGVPQSVAESGTPTSGVHVLDLAWILPAMVLTALWLWRRLAVGYALAGVLLTFMSVLLIAIVAMVVSMSLYAGSAAGGMALVFGVITAATFLLAVRYLRALQGPPEDRPRTAAGREHNGQP